jgi:hypothetical protein
MRIPPPGARRTPRPAGHIKALVDLKAAESADWYVGGGGTNPALSAASHVNYEVTNGSPLLGQRIRISGWMKANGVENWAGGSLFIGDKDGHLVTWDDSTSRPVRGTTDWQQIDFVTDLPDKPCTITKRRDLVRQFSNRYCSAKYTHHGRAQLSFPGREPERLHRDAGPRCDA